MQKRTMVQLVVLLGSAILMPGNAGAQDHTWVGENILPTKPSNEITFGTRQNDKQITYSFSGRWPFKVREEKDGWIRIHDGNHEGWAKKSDFVLAKEAYSYFSQRIDANSKDHFALLMRGGYWSELKEYDKAIQDYDECLRHNPSSAAAFNNRGNAHLDKKENDKAIEDFTESIRLNPKTVTSRLGRGIAWKNKKEYDKAIHDYDEALQIDPRYSHAFYHRGMAWFIKKENDKAISDFGEAIEIDPRYVAAYYERGLVWMDKKDYDKAIDDFGDAVRFDPKHSQAFYRRGLAWRWKKDYDKAIHDYDEAIRLNPKYVYALQSRGLVFRFTKQYEKSIRDYEEAIKLDPKYAPSQSQLSWLLATCPEEKYRDGKRAVALAKKACELTHDDPFNLDILAVAYAETGNFSEAIKCENRAMASAAFEKQSGSNARKRLKLFEENKPYHEQ